MIVRVLIPNAPSHRRNASDVPATTHKGYSEAYDNDLMMPTAKDSAPFDLRWFRVKWNKCWFSASKERWLKVISAIICSS